MAPPPSAAPQPRRGHAHARGRGRGRGSGRVSTAPAVRPARAAEAPPPPELIAPSQQHHLRDLIGARGVSASAVEAARTDFRKTLTRILLHVPDDEANRGSRHEMQFAAADLLWADTTYPFYTRLRQAARSGRRGARGQLMRIFLLEEWRFWADLLVQADTSFRPIQGDTPEDGKKETDPSGRVASAHVAHGLEMLQSMGLLPPNTRPPPADEGHQRLLSRILISMGDLARYASAQHVVLVEPSARPLTGREGAPNPCSPPHLAAALYRAAHLLYPPSGRAWSQLGALAAQASDRAGSTSSRDAGPLAATASYYRAQLSLRPDPVAKQSAEQNRLSLLRRLDPQDDSSGRNERASWQQDVLRLHATVATLLRALDPKLDDADSSARPGPGEVVEALAAHVAQINTALGPAASVDGVAGLSHQLKHLDLSSSSDVSPQGVEDSLVAGMAAVWLVRRLRQRLTPGSGGRQTHETKQAVSLARQAEEELLVHVLTLLTHVFEAAHGAKTALLPAACYGIRWTRAQRAYIARTESHAERHTQAPKLLPVTARLWSAVNVLCSLESQPCGAPPEYWGMLGFLPLQVRDVPAPLLAHTHAEDGARVYFIVHDAQAVMQERERDAAKAREDAVIKAATADATDGRARSTQPKAESDEEDIVDLAMRAAIDARPVSWGRPTIAIGESPWGSSGPWPQPTSQATVSPSPVDSSLAQVPLPVGPRSALPSVEEESKHAPSLAAQGLGSGTSVSSARGTHRAPRSASNSAPGSNRPSRPPSAPGSGSPHGSSTRSPLPDTFSAWGLTSTVAGGRGTWPEPAGVSGTQWACSRPRTQASTAEDLLRRVFSPAAPAGTDSPLALPSTLPHPWGPTAPSAAPQAPAPSQAWSPPRAEVLGASTASGAHAVPQTHTHDLSGRAPSLAGPSAPAQPWPAWTAPAGSSAGPALAYRPSPWSSSGTAGLSWSEPYASPPSAVPAPGSVPAPAPAPASTPPPAAARGPVSTPLGAPQAWANWGAAAWSGAGGSGLSTVWPSAAQSVSSAPPTGLPRVPPAGLSAPAPTGRREPQKYRFDPVLGPVPMSPGR